MISVDFKINLINHTELILRIKKKHFLKKLIVINIRCSGRVGLVSDLGGFNHVGLVSDLQLGLVSDLGGFNQLGLVSDLGGFNLVALASGLGVLLAGACVHFLFQSSRRLGFQFFDGVRNP